MNAVILLGVRFSTKLCQWTVAEQKHANSMQLQQHYNKFGKEWKPTLWWVPASKPDQTEEKLLTKIMQKKVEEKFNMIRVAMWK